MTSSKISSPIPKWVTVYGFSVLVVLVCLLVLFSFYFKVERVVQVLVHFKAGSAVVELTTDEFSLLKDLDVTRIRLSKTEFLTVDFDFKNMRIEGNNMHVPIDVLNFNGAATTNNAKTYDGQIVIDQTSLLSKVFAH